MLRHAHPLILVCVDKNGRCPGQLQTNLALLQAQILSVLTQKQLQKQLLARPSLDLRPLLSGTDVFLNSLCEQFQTGNPWSWLNALESLPLGRQTRKQLNDALLNSRGDSSLLYGLIACDSRFCAVVRPRQHSLHPPDLHLVFNMLFHTSVFKDGEHWVPICLPKFNANGFLYAYVTDIRPVNSSLPLKIVLISPSRQAFYEMQKVGNALIDQVPMPLVEKVCSARRLSILSIGVQPIEYFVYKSKQNVQFLKSERVEKTPTANQETEVHESNESNEPSEPSEPSGEDDNPEESQEPQETQEAEETDVISEIQEIQEIQETQDIQENESDVLSTSDIEKRFCTIQAQMYINNQRIGLQTLSSGTFLGWHSPLFEVYVYTSSYDKQALGKAVRKLVAYIRRYEQRLFLVDGAVF